jgi:hypothetical protein
MSASEVVWFLMRLVVTYVVLAIALYGLARLVHSLLYTEIPRGLTWRAFVAAAAIWVMGLGLPLLINQVLTTKKWPITFDHLFLAASSRDEMRFKEFSVPGEGGRTTVYVRKKNPRGLFEYVDADGKQLPASAQTITGTREDTGEKVTFKREVEKKTRLGNETTVVRYVNEENGLVMTAEQLGTVSSRAFGQFVLSIFGGLITLATWFLALWLLLLFQWPHALGISVPCMLLAAFAMNFVV